MGPIAAGGLCFIILSAAAQIPSTHCCKCASSERSDDVICLSAKEMRNRVAHAERIRTPGHDSKLNLAGTMVFRIQFDNLGKVARVCVQSGHPMAIATAMESLPKWTFKPVVVDGVAKGGCGRITIKYRFRDGKSSTELR